MESPARKWRAVGRIERTLLDGGEDAIPSRPETIARYRTIPQLSYDCCNKARASGVLILPAGPCLILVHGNK